MYDLATIANIAEIFGAATVVTGVIFGAIQIQHYRKQRADLAAIELVRSFQNPEFIHALRAVLELPARCSGANLKEHGPDCENAAMTVAITVEAIGLMVYRRILDYQVARELMGGMVQGAWDRLNCWVEDRREVTERSEFGEWFQWLAERLAADCAAEEHAPVAERAQHWQP